MNNQTSNIAVRETEVNRVMNDLSKAVEYLTQSVSATEARLTGVVRNIPLSNSKEVPDTLYETAHAQEINKINYNLIELRERLDSLLSRLEL